MYPLLGISSFSCYVTFILFNAPVLSCFNIFTVKLFLYAIIITIIM